MKYIRLDLHIWEWNVIYEARKKHTSMKHIKQDGYRWVWNMIDTV